MDERIEVPPDPSRVIEGLRDTGYRFETAVADIVDNSVAAGANRVDIGVVMDYSGKVEVTVADDGCGMARDELVSAMRYGAPERPDPSSLGKFGLGLKTASTAFSRRLSVVSRREGEISKATWDLDHVAREAKWELLLSEPSPAEVGALDATAGMGPGTLVIWENVDRLLPNYSVPGGKPARRALDRHVAALRDHARMVYQRFLDPSDGRVRTVTMALNGSALEPWDPFCQGVSEVVAQDTNVCVELGDGATAEFGIRAFILPRKEDFPSSAAAQEAKISNDLQGIYVYRENRLIHGPDWLGMFRSEPHLSLCRVEMSFDHRLDAAFQIDIKKSQILLNSDLFTWISEEFLPGPRRAAEQLYRLGQRAKAHLQSEQGMHSSSNVTIESKAPSLDRSQVKVLNPDSGDAEITNERGTTRVHIKVIQLERPDAVRIHPVPSIDDGLLWEPSMIGGSKAVSINTSHPFYGKVYLPNRLQSVTIQGLDSLLWALSTAELSTLDEATKYHFEALRYEVSRILRRLVEDLPEPDFDDD